MNKFFVILLLTSAFFSFAQLVDKQWVLEHYTKKEFQIKMRDGIKLFTVVYAPKNNSEKHPILLMRTPYSCAPYGNNEFSTRLYKTHWSKYLLEGYIIVIQDVRGRCMSEGTFMDVRPFNFNKKTNK